eukprot:TRINITY_DN1255_c0_g1_i2.p1 TRINITY_DN1255_c0_g1~~TRINITY_DN1255_c0_g1_i2.p1  ORF type:complete len:265 (+),score=67.95 TRINITY_DN1255_c0_g1_i2:85-879(+)
MVLQAKRKLARGDQVRKDGASTKPAGDCSQASGSASASAPKRIGRKSLGGVLFRSLTCGRMGAALAEAGALYKAMDKEVRSQAAKERACEDVCAAEVDDYESAKADADAATALEAEAIRHFIGLSEQLRALRAKMEDERRRKADLLHKLALLDLVALERQRADRQSACDSLAPLLFGGPPRRNLSRRLSDARSADIREAVTPRKGDASGCPTGPAASRAGGSPGGHAESSGYQATLVLSPPPQDAQPRSLASLHSRQAESIAMP